MTMDINSVPSANAEEETTGVQTTAAETPPSSAPQEVDLLKQPLSSPAPATVGPPVDLITNMLGYEPEVLPEDMPPEDSPAHPSAPTPVTDMMASIGLGAAQGVMEAKDFAVEMLWPHNKQAQDVFNTKSTARQWMEKQAKELRDGSIVNGIAHSIAQFGVGFIGLGKLKWAKEGLQWARSAGKTATIAAETARGAAASTVVMDPHQERLSNLVESYPALSNPITRYLAARPEDTKADGRLKNALEGVVMDVSLAGAIAAVAKGIKFARAGDIDAANKAGAEADKLFQKVGPESWTVKMEPTGPSSPMPPSGPSSDLLSPADAATIRGEGVSPEIAQGVKDLNIQPTGPVMDAHQGPTMAVPPERQALNEAAENVRGMELPKVGPTMDAQRGPTMDLLRAGEGGSILPGNRAAGGADEIELARQGSPGGDSARSAVGSDQLPDHSQGHLGPPDGRSRVSSGNTHGERGGPEDGVRTSGTTDLPRGGRAPDAFSVDGSRDLDIHSDSRVDGLEPSLVSSLDSEMALTERKGGAREGQTARAPSELDHERALRRLRKDNDAIIKYGSRDEAIEAGYQFRPRDTANIIPWQKLRTTDEAMAWMGQSIEAQSKFINKARGGDAQGVLRDARVDEMIAQRAAVWNESPAILRGQLMAAGEQAPEMAAAMETSFLIANKAFQDAYDLAVRINADNFAGFGSRAEAIAALQHRLGMATAMYANGKAIVSNAARTMRRMRGEFAITDAQLAGLKNNDPEELIRTITGTGGNLKALAKVASMGLAGRFTDRVASIYAANLLWSWSTHAVNMATSAAMLVWRPLEAGLGSVAVQGLGKLKGDEAMIASARSVRARAYRETIVLGSLIGDGWSALVEASLRGDSRLAPRTHEAATVATSAGVGDVRLNWRPLNSFEDVIHNGLRAAMVTTTLPLRAMTAADEMMRTMRYRAVMTARAMEEAETRGLRQGTTEFTVFIRNRVEGSFDEFGRATDADALREASTSTFQQELTSETFFGGNTLGKMWQGTAASVPAVRLITPFIKTPTNLIRYGVKLTPGVNLLQKEYVSAIVGDKGPEEAARAAGQMMLGIGLASTAAMMWANGSLIGSGPRDHQHDKQWRAAGNMAYSYVRHNDDGTKSFIQLNRLDPVVAPLLLVADAMTLYTSGTLHERDRDGIASAIVMAFANVLKNKTYLKSISDFINALTQERDPSAFFKRWTPGLMPFSSLLNDAKPDPYMREVREVVDGFINKVPGWSASLPPQRDGFGDPILAPGRFTSSTRNAGALTRTLDDIHAYTGAYLATPPASRSFATGDVDLRDFTLESGRNAYDRYQELAGHPPSAIPLRKMLERLVTSTAFQKLPHGSSSEGPTKSGAIMGVVAKYRQVAFNVLLSESPSLRKMVRQRSREIALAAAQGTRTPHEAATSARMDGVMNMLKAFGVSR